MNMRLLAPLVGNPWCLLVLVLVILLIVGAAVIVATTERRRAPAFSDPPHSLPASSLAASAPVEGLAVLHARLSELRQHLPPGSDDERWLSVYLNRLRVTLNDAYDRLEAASPMVQEEMLDRLATEVEALAGVVNLQLGARLTAGTDRQALEAQLDALREALP